MYFEYGLDTDLFLMMSEVLSSRENIFKNVSLQLMIFTIDVSVFIKKIVTL